MNHSIVPPSSGHIWGKPDGCTAWPTMNQLYPETEPQPEAMEGEASHEIGACLIEGATVGSMSSWSSFDGLAAANGVVFTEEMFDGAELYAKDVQSVMRETRVFSGSNIGIERRLEMSQIHELSFGTTDCYLFDAKKGHLYIWDYKFGYEIYEAFENWQSINYYAGIYNLLGFDGIKDQHITVHIRIVQPRAFHRDGPIREWTVKASDLRAHINILKGNAHKSLGPDAEAVSGSHCKHCPGRHACEAGLTGGMRLYEAASKPTPVELPVVALGVQLAIVIRARKQLECLESGFKTQVKALIRSGKTVPGWSAEPTFGKEKFDKPFEEVVAMGKMLGHDLQQQKTITPNQARKLGVDEAVITAYSSTPRTGTTIVPDNVNKIKQAFSK